MKELLRKKSVKISILLIILLVVMGIVGINVQSAQKSKEYEAHIAAAEKYLSELDYEQAIAEYTMAFEIDPREEVVEALEETYLAYARTYTDVGDYEKAVSILKEGYEKIGRERFQKAEEALEQTYLAYAGTYMDAGDYETAVSILQEGYEEIGWNSLQKKTEEVTVLLAQKQEEEEQKRIEEEKRASGMIEFPFQMKDITVMGYDLAKDRFAQIEELYLHPSEFQKDEWISENTYMHSRGDTSDGGHYGLYTDHHNGSEMKWLDVISPDGSGWQYHVNYYDGNAGGTVLRINGIGTQGKAVFDQAVVNVPVTAGDTYEDWCRVMQIDRIKENNLRPEERNGQVGIWDEDGNLLCSGIGHGGGEYWLFSTEKCQGIYCEAGIACEFVFSDNRSSTFREEWPVRMIQGTINNGVFTEIRYQSW